MFVLYIRCVGRKNTGKTKTLHLVVFWLGLTADTIGTGAMAELSGTLFKLNFSGITGNLAIVLMLFHAIWEVLC